MAPHKLSSRIRREPALASCQNKTKGHFQSNLSMAVQNKFRQHSPNNQLYGMSKDFYLKHHLRIRQA
jgi:alpha-L-arabinofuranosidase